MKLFLSVLVVVVAATTQIGFSNNSESWQKKIGVSLRKLDQRGPTDILVLLKAQVNLDGADHLLSKQAKGEFVVKSLKQIAEQTQPDLVAMLQSRGVEFQRFYIMNAVAVRGADPRLIEEIAKRDDVRKLIADPVIRQSEIAMRVRGGPSDARGTGDNIVSTGAEAVWKIGFKGQGIVVAGQDTGVDWTHPALQAHYRGSNRGGGAVHDGNWHDSIRTSISGGTNKCGLDLSEPCDDHSHGTHTMGTMIGNDGAENAIGMAPGAQWIACRNMESGYGRPSTYMECYEWFIAPYPKGGSPKDGNPKLAPHVINNSWGCPADEGCEGSEMIPVLKAVYKAGIMNVVSAGNSGPGCGTILDQPATISDYGFSVGAHDHRNNTIAGFSSRGPSALDGKVGPDITAPGVSIRSSVPGGTYEQGFWSGTSMAGPHVAGAVALLWSAQPKLIGDIDRTIEILRSTAIATTSNENCSGTNGSAIPNNTYGYGRLNIEAAVKKALSL